MSNPILNWRYFYRPQSDGDASGFSQAVQAWKNESREFVGVEMTQRKTRDDAIQRKTLVENTTGNADMEKLRGWLLGSQVKEMRSYRNYSGSGSRVRGCQLSDFISCFLPVNMSTQPNTQNCCFKQLRLQLVVGIHLNVSICAFRIAFTLCWRMQAGDQTKRNSMVIHFIWFLRTLYFMPDVSFFCEFPQSGTKLWFLCMSDDELGVAPPRLRVLLKFDFIYGWVWKEGWLLF